MSGCAVRVETLVIGGGQAGLAVGYYLMKANRPFLIVDANARIGDPWRNRWDALRLFTPAHYSSLPGWSFPAPRRSYPTKDEVAAYLEAYADRFQLPVRTGVHIDHLGKDDDRFVATSAEGRIEADHVVVASGAYHSPRIPDIAADLDPAIRQLHSSAYRNPSQLRDGPVLVVGAGNSGAEIAWDVSATHHTWLSGRDVGHLPWRLETTWDMLLTPLVWFVGSRVITMRTPIGRRARSKLVTRGAPLERVQPKDLATAGVERIPRTVAVAGGAPVVEGGRTVDAANVIWCTGFRSELPWIHLGVFADDGEPIHDRGVSIREPGLYFVGRFFLSSMTSALIGGVGSDAARIATHIERDNRSDGSDQP